MFDNYIQGEGLRHLEQFLELPPLAGCPCHLRYAPSFERSDERNHHVRYEHPSCMAKELGWMRERFEELSKSGLNWDPPVLESANSPRVIIDGKDTIMLLSLIHI